MCFLMIYHSIFPKPCKNYHNILWQFQVYYIKMIKQKKANQSWNNMMNQYRKTVAVPCRSKALCKSAGSSSRCWRGWSCCRPTPRRCPPSPPRPLAPNPPFPERNTRVCDFQMTHVRQEKLNSYQEGPSLTESEGSWLPRLFQRSFSSSSITWFMALFSHVSTATPACLSRSRRASAFAFTVWGERLCSP